MNENETKLSWNDELNKDIVDCENSTADDTRLYITDPGTYDFKIDLRTKEDLIVKRQKSESEVLDLKYKKYKLVDNEKDHISFTPFQYSEFLRELKKEKIDGTKPFAKIKLKVSKSGNTKTTYAFWVELSEQ